MKMFQLKVPATSANLGPGFDTIGMALKLYNEYEVERISNGIEFVGCDGISLEENLVYSSMQKTLSKYGCYVDGIRIHANAIDIPISRGLGSSAASIAAGIMIANQLMNNILTEDDIIHIGTEIEGHPDNIVPAVVGGLTVSIYEGEKVVYSRVTVPQNLRFVVMIPDFAVSTHNARKVLPEQYSKADCIFNISRAAMFVAAMNNGEPEKLRIATEDKIHQPYRASLIPDIYDIFEYVKSWGSMAEVISGSGSTLLAIIDKDNQLFEKEMKKYFDTLKEVWHLKVLEIDTEGAMFI